MPHNQCLPIQLDQDMGFKQPVQLRQNTKQQSSEILVADVALWCLGTTRPYAAAWMKRVSASSDKTLPFSVGTLDVDGYDATLTNW